MSAFRIENSVALTLSHLAVARAQSAADALESPTPRVQTLWEDTLQLSKAALTAQKEYPESPMHEASESLAETIAEAGGGDPQAQRALASRDAARQMAGGMNLPPKSPAQGKPLYGNLWE